MAGSVRWSQDTREAHDRGGERAHPPRPGLVLLYAAAHAEMPSAFPLRGDAVTVGRDEGAHIPIRDDAVSRRHATILREAGAFSVVDEGSRNGTFVDGQRVSRARLHPGARVRFGDALFTFVEDAADEYAAYGLDGMVRGAPVDQVHELIGGLKIRALGREIERLARTDLTCVVRGETGTGKELVARGVHRLSGRTGSLQTINCAAVPAQLFESELFGYKRGAFSGADRDKPGLVHGAQHGTLFLDEIGELPLEMQAKILRLLQQREVLPVGGARPETVDVRVLAATHRDLPELVRSGRFREDLLARLEEHVFYVPPLRERKEDVYMLATAFVRKHGKRPLTFAFDAVDAMLAYDWPANVRELESAVKRAVALEEGSVIGKASLPPALLRVSARPAATDESEEPDDGFHRGAPKESTLRSLLAEHGGNIAAVARALGKRRMQVQRLMQKYAIPPSEYRSGGDGDDE